MVGIVLNDNAYEQDIRELLMAFCPGEEIVHEAHPSLRFCVEGILSEDRTEFELCLVFEGGSSFRALAMEALEYDDIVLINAPFTQEIRDLDYITTLRAELKKKQAELVVIWVDTNPEVCHQRMIDRASDRDMWKLNHWDEYILGVNFNPPLSLKLENQPDSLLIFHNSSDEEFEESMKTIVAQLEAAVANRVEIPRTRY